MKIRSDCIPCIVQQCLLAARAKTENAWLHQRSMKAVLAELGESDFSPSPAELLSQCVGAAARVLGETDLCEGQRTWLTETFEELAEEFRERIAAAEEPLAAALLASAAANAADELALRPKDLPSLVRGAYDNGFARGEAARFVEALDGAGSLVFIYDNAGEALVDELLLEQLEARGHAVTTVVKPGGLLHDLTASERPESPRPSLETGGRSMSLEPTLCSEAFNEALSAADLVIAKGSAAYQTLATDLAPCVFLLRAKCKIMAKELGIKRGRCAMIFGDEVEKIV